MDHSTCSWSLGALSLSLLLPAAIGAQGLEGVPIEVDPDPIVVVGDGTGAEELFDRVRPPFLLPPGIVVVPVGGSLDVRLFSLEGEHLATFGREGEGPGEFTGIDGAWARGDTIEVFDRGQQRVTRIAPGGDMEFVTLRGSNADTGRPGIVGDTWAFAGFQYDRASERDPMTVLAFDRDGAETGVLTSVQGFLRYFGPMMAGPTPMSPRAEFASHGTTLYVAETSAPVIRVIDGDQSREIRWAVENEMPASDAQERVIDEAVRRADVERRDRIAANLSAAPVPDRVPAFSSFKVDELGFVWVRPYVPMRDAAALGGPLGYGRVGAGGEWRIFSPSGAEVARVSMPDGFEPHDIARDMVVGIRRDAFDVETVEVLPLVRRSPSASSHGLSDRCTTAPS